MARKIQSASLVFIIAMFGAGRSRAQSNETPQGAAVPAAPVQVQKIITKDPQYVQLLNPPAGNDFLQTYSKGYREKTAEIEAGIADIGDEKLRDQERRQEWSRVLKKDRDRFRAEAESTFNAAKIEFLQKHQDAFLDVGNIAYDEDRNILSVTASPSAPIEANFRVAMNKPTMNRVYEQFHRMAAQEIDEKARAYVAKAGDGSICSRNPDWCYKYEAEDIEKSLRSARIVVVAQGDVEAKRIDRLLLVDHDTESVLHELDPHISALNNAGWRFSVESVSAVSAEPQVPETRVQGPAGSPAGPETSHDKPDATVSVGAGDAASNQPAAPDSSRPRIRVPGKVEAASIIDQTTPQYPPQARARQIQGDVVLYAIIDKEGKISEVQVLSGDSLLAKPALEAVRQWRYKPMLTDGEPVEVETNITITFSLND